VESGRGGKMEMNKKYIIIYDDKGFKPVRKIGIIVWKEGNLFRLDTDAELLNTNYVIRADPVESGRGDEE
jgi:hypothetical protein